jgi:IPT/TIG domain
MGLSFSRWTLPASLAGLLLALGGCGGSGAPSYNQTPAITLIDPTNITAGSQDFTVFISGTGFISGPKGVSFAYWNGSPRSTSYNITTGQLQMTVLASDVANQGQAQITVINPPPGGGEARAAVNFQVEPVQPNGPVISSLDPASAPVNSKTPPLIAITGSNFVSTDVVTWNGQYRGAGSVYKDQQDMTIQPGAADLSAVGIASISVSDPGLVLASPSVDFAITGPDAPSPTVTSLAPSSATAGSPDLEVLVKGKGFVADSAVLWNSVPVATAYLSNSQLMALIPAADLAASGSADVSVMNPAPGGGTSSTSTFTINAQ